MLILAPLTLVFTLLQPAHDPTVVPAAEPLKTAPQGELAKPVTLSITIDAQEAPELKEWGEKAKAICIEWYPKLADELKSEGFKPRESIVFVFKKKLFAPAATSGDTISISAEYVRTHPDDLGMMVHELAHVVQAYPGQKKGADLGWLTEGIADYVRFWKYEPATRQAPINKEKASYKNSYRVSAAFLGWLVDKKDPQAVAKLNARMRKGGCDAAIFNDLLNKSVDDLWTEFIADGAPSSPKVAPVPASAPPASAAPESKPHN